MSKVAVVTDSACDIPADVLAGHDITVVPLTIRFGDTEYVDRKDLTPADFWSKVKASAVLPETAAPSPGAFEAAYRAAADKGANGVVTVCLSGDLSATKESAELAARAVADTIPVRVVDSKSITMGQGFMVLAAAQIAETGAGIDDVAGAAEDLKGRTKVYGVLNTLENLKKGGRIGGAQAMLGSLLSIKPIIDISTGKVEEESKQRTRAKSLRYIVDKVRQAGTIEQLAVMHGDAADVEEFLDLLDPVFPRSKAVVGDIGAVIGTHGGPGVVGVCFVTSR